jgi:hypothetical protein
MTEFLVFFSSVGFVALLIKNYFMNVRMWDMEQRMENISLLVVELHIKEAVDELDKLDKNMSDPDL